MKKIKFVIIGAGSAGFGPGSIADVVAREEMKEFDVTVTLVDIDVPALQRMLKLAQMIGEHHKSKARFEATPDRREALKGADYVITSVARRRWDLCCVSHPPQPRPHDSDLPGHGEPLP